VECVNEVELVQNALSPVTSDGVALGTGSLMWSDLFVASGGVINFNNGDVTLTHSACTLTVAGGTLAAPTILATDIKIGEDDETKIDFADANIINLHADNIKALSVHKTSCKADLRIYEASNYISIIPPALCDNWTLTLPANNGCNGQVLTTNGSGVTSWASASGGCVACDSSPQLGGNLDVVTHSIVSACNRDINIVPNGTGSIGLNTTGVSAHLVEIGGSFTGTADGSAAFSVNPSITGNAGDSTYVARIKGTIVEAGSGTHPIALGLAVETPTMTNAGATTTTAASLWVQGAPTGATTNYAVYVDGGTSRFDGDIEVLENATHVSVTKGIAKAWMQFYHAVTVHSSYNSSITHTNTGVYTVTLTTNMENGDYAVAMAGSYDRLLVGSNGSQNTTSSLVLNTAQFDGTLINVPNCEAQTVGFAVYGEIT